MALRLKSARLSLGVMFCGVLAAQVVQADIVLNGSFESPDIGGPGGGNYYLTISPGTEGTWGFTGWKVDAGNVDVVDIADWNSELHTTSTAYDGGQVLDLHGTQGGILHQDFATTVGQTYGLFFAYSSNPLIGASTDTATVSVIDVGSNSNLFSPYLISHADNTGWSTSTVNFTATGTTTRLTFASPIPGQSSFGGIVLDDVRVEPNAVPEPSAMTLAGMGALGLFVGGRLRRRCRGKGTT